MDCNLLSLSECVIIKHVTSMTMFQSPYNSRMHFFVILDVTYYITCFPDVNYIFVGNTRGDRTDTVEKFRYDEKRRKLYHLRTYRDPTFTQSVFLKMHFVNQY